MPNEREFVKKQLSDVKEKILVIASAENTRKRRQKKRKARRNFEKKKQQQKKTFKFTKKLFEGEKNGVLNIPKEDLEAHLRKKYTDPLTDTPLRRLNEPNCPHPLEEKLTIHFWN